MSDVRTLQYMSLGFGLGGTGVLLSGYLWGWVLAAIALAFLIMAWFASEAVPCDDPVEWHGYLYSDCPDQDESVCVQCPLWDGLQCVGVSDEQS